MNNLQKQKDEHFMLECLSLAHKGIGDVNPNPMVGAVIVKKGRIIGKGYHHNFGGPHAEVNAIANSTESVKGSTIYVNLEPCNYFGKTPPCTDLLIKKGIKKVVIGSLDPNPRVTGKGVKQLRQAGIEVRTGILGNECRKLNEVFEKYITTHLPFVTLKIAQTLDGKIADTNYCSRWISNKTSRDLVHKLRSHYDAILVGATTVIKDNPELTTHSKSKNNPIRIIIDGNLNCLVSAKVFNDNKSKTILVITKQTAKTNVKKVKDLRMKGVNVIELTGNTKGQISTTNLLRFLGKMGISSILVEGGEQTFSRFIEERSTDKLLMFIAPKILGSGIASFNLNNRNINKSIVLKNINSFMLEDNIVFEGYF
ncbi:MAG: bifunctional diaminohydroxyphosphoribosylaminopyrimidine deaminase/5-amino-6-(5-phosphoribosylamino)uracil reductase RibD [Ignavibacteriales bacterium]|nr:bifunctional diaminohydroxyphosphoribosylaminopyrimidine deaminase/5-amino-6-(5-phosphoribosylamino)uracil reductase RibD [Ignavibacteriales bacterium]